MNGVTELNVFNILKAVNSAALLAQTVLLLSRLILILAQYVISHHNSNCLNQQYLKYCINSLEIEIGSSAYCFDCYRQNSSNKTGALVDSPMALGSP